MNSFFRRLPTLGSLSSGVAFIALGTAVNAACNLAVVGIVTRKYDLADSALFIAWWATVSIAPLGLGLVEITLTRKSISFTSDHIPKLPQKLVGEGISISSILFLTMSIASIGIANGQDASSGLYILSLFLFSVLSLLQVLQRGHALSQKKFGDSAIQIGLDGFCRLIFTLVGVLYFEMSVQYLIFATTMSMLIAIFFMKTRNKVELTLPRSITDFRISKELLRMSTATFGTVAVSYLVAPWFASQVDSTLLVTLFIASLTISRVPIQFAGAFFSPVMVHLAALHELGDLKNAKKLEIKVLSRTAIIAFAFVPVYVLLAPHILTLYLGIKTELSSWVTFGQALVAGLLLIGSVVQASLVAQNKWRFVASAWLPAIFFMFILFILPLDATWVAVLGPVAAASFVLLRMLYPMWKEFAI